MHNKYSHYIASDSYNIYHFSTTTNKDHLIKNAKHKEHIIITCCYQSTHVIQKYIKKHDFGLFDLVIFDEAHYLGITNNKYYRNYGKCTYPANTKQLDVEVPPLYLAAKNSDILAKMQQGKCTGKKNKKKKRG